MTRFLLPSALTVAAVIVAAPGSALAFCRTTTCDPNLGMQCRKNDNGCIRDGAPLTWSTSPIVYRFSAKGSTKLDSNQARDVIKKAFDAWTEVQCSQGPTSLVFRQGPDVTEDKPLTVKQASEPYGIYFRDDTWPHNDANESIALTNQIYGVVTGTIDYADIEINTAQVDFSLTDENRAGTDLQAVITHEVGHYIGLAHSTNPDSIMVPRYCQEGNDRCKGGIDRARALADDDRSAVCALYPPNVPGPVPSAAACSASGRGRAADIAALFGLLCATAAVLRRRVLRS